MNWENPEKLVDERIIATNREQMTVCMSTCLGNPRRTGKLEENWKPRKTGYMKETEMCVELQLVGEPRSTGELGVPS